MLLECFLHMNAASFENHMNVGSNFGLERKWKQTVSWPLLTITYILKLAQKYSPTYIITAHLQKDSAVDLERIEYYKELKNK